MEGLIPLFLIAGILAILGVAAVRFGADSRPAYSDDWSRTAAR